jgi:hypothetical protein
MYRLYMPGGQGPVLLAAMPGSGVLEPTTSGTGNLLSALRGGR